MKKAIIFSNNTDNTLSEIEAEIKHGKYKGCACEISGTLGLWYGTKKIIPVRCHSIMSAIYRCIGDSEDVTISFDRKHIYMECVHHDGTNRFTLTPKEVSKVFASGNKRYHSVEIDADFPFC